VLIGKCYKGLAHGLPKEKEATLYNQICGGVSIWRDYEIFELFVTDYFPMA
jgi:hypothetical protein